MCNRAGCIKQTDLCGRGPSTFVTDRHTFFTFGLRQIKAKLDCCIEQRTGDVQLHFCQGGSVKMVIMSVPVRLEPLALAWPDSHYSVNE